MQAATDYCDEKEALFGIGLACVACCALPLIAQWAKVAGPSVPQVLEEAECQMKQSALYLVAALAEIGGCFAFWAWLRLDRSPLWLLPGMASLAGFAWALTLSQAPAAGRTYAAYGGIYILASLVWLWAVEGIRPDRWDTTGAAICLLGAMIIFHGPGRTGTGIG